MTAATVFHTPLSAFFSYGQVRTIRRWKQDEIQDRGTQIILWVVIGGSLRSDEGMHKFFLVDMPDAIAGCGHWPFGIVVIDLGVRAAAIAATHPGRNCGEAGFYGSSVTLPISVWN
jgi:hypothetical protein